MKQNKEERIASLVLILGSLAYLVGGFLIPMPTLKQQLGPDAFPKGVGVAMLILSGIYVFQQLRGGGGFEQGLFFVRRNLQHGCRPVQQHERVVRSHTEQHLLQRAPAGVGQPPP